MSLKCSDRLVPCRYNRAATLLRLGDKPFSFVTIGIGGSNVCPTRDLNPAGRFQTVHRPGIRCRGHWGQSLEDY